MRNPCQHDYDRLEQQARSIEKRIHELQHELTRLRARQNALVPVNRNSEDVLLCIFTLLALRPQRDYPNDTDIINVSHVCQHWRALALGNPSLWTDIPVNTMAQTNAFLARSCTLPIRIAARELASMDGYAPVMDSVAAHIPRLRSLLLSFIGSFPGIQKWLTLLTSPAPLLEELALVGSHVDIHFPAQSSCPVLRSLTICGAFPYNLPVFTNLRYLYLAYLQSKVDLSALLHILRGCPDLETLTLWLNLNEDGEEDARPSRLVTLPHLSQLTLQDTYIGDEPIGDKYTLLKHLALPATTRFKIKINHASHPPRVRLPWAADTLPALVGLRSLHLDVHPRRPIYIDEQLFELHAFREGELEPTLHLEVSDNARASYTWTRALSPLIDVSEVETYVLRFRYDDPGDTKYRPVVDSLRWRSALAHLAALKTLCVCGAEEASYAPLFDALRETRGDDAAGTEAVLCPFLETLEVDGAVCTTNFWAALNLVISTRHKLPGGIPLKVVHIKNARRGSACVEEEYSAMRELRRRLQVLEVGFAEKTQ